MKSRIVAALELDQARLLAEVETLLGASPPHQEYSEYRFGSFHTFVLACPSGDERDALFQGQRHGTRFTQLGLSLAYLRSLIESTFQMSRLRMARVYAMADALLIPHRDYVEFGEKARHMVRLHVPIRTNPRAMHSEGSHVFHMREGEIWLLDVKQIHAASNASSEPRLHLVLDLETDDGDLGSVFDPRIDLAAQLDVDHVPRAAMDQSVLDGLRSLAPLLDESSYRDILQLLCRIHLSRHVDCAAVFDWLLAICQEAGNSMLADRTLRFERYLNQQRQVGERFQF